MAEVASLGVGSFTGGSSSSTSKAGSRRNSYHGTGSIAGSRRSSQQGVAKRESGLSISGSSAHLHTKQSILNNLDDFETAIDRAIQDHKTNTLGRSNSAQNLGRTTVSGKVKPRQPSSAFPYAKHNLRNFQFTKTQLRPNSPQKWGRGCPKVDAKAAYVDPRWMVPNGVFEQALDPGTLFKKMYQRGDIPVGLRHGSKLCLEWKMPMEKMNIPLFLPIFIEGMNEKKFPFSFVAEQGSFAMLEAASAQTSVEIMNPIFQSLRKLLATKEPVKIVLIVRVLRALLEKGPAVSAAMVPFYKYVLPTFNLYIMDIVNIGDAMDFARGDDFRNIGAIIEELLNWMERTGGSSVFYSIKFFIPTYESCVF